MSIANPQDREEFKQYVLTKLGAPVLEVNVADEQLDLCIQDAFQYFNERSHFNGTEQLNYRVKIEKTFEYLFKTATQEDVAQSQEPTIAREGMVKSLQLVNPGTQYPDPLQPYLAQPTSMFLDGSPYPGYGSQGPQGPQGAQGLTVDWGEKRTTTGGILDVQVHNTGYGYRVGDFVTLDGGNDDCILEVTEVMTESPLHGYITWESQRNYIVMPRDVVGVTNVLSFNASNSNEYATAGVIPGAALTNPFLIGGAGVGGGSTCPFGNTFDLISYYTLKQWLADLSFLMYPQVNFTFNQRTHRLFLNTNRIPTNNYMVMSCDVKPSPDTYPDLWDDLFMKRYTCALAKKQWGSNLIKYSQVNLPGGITMNGELIYQEGVREQQELETRFAMDYQDPVLDIVG